MIAVISGRFLCFFLWTYKIQSILYKAIPHNSKCRCSEREVQAAKQKAQIILVCIIEHFCNADCASQPRQRCLSRQAGIVRYCHRYPIIWNKYIAFAAPVQCFFAFFAICVQRAAAARCGEKQNSALLLCFFCFFGCGFLPKFSLQGKKVWACSLFWHK